MMVVNKMTNKHRLTEVKV
jgi:hypothetical protein